MKEYLQNSIDKVDVLNTKINSMADKLGIKEKTHQKRNEKVLAKQEKAASLKKYRMKSFVQSYELRDSEEFEGVMELENLLEETEEMEIAEFAAAVHTRFTQIVTCQTKAK